MRTVISKSTAILAILVLMAGCATADARRSRSAPPSVSSDDRYPYSEIEKVYDAVLHGMTDHYFAKFPELDKEHTRKLQAFIAAEYPRDRFVKDMIRDADVPKFERALRDPHYRVEKAFQDCFAVVVNVSIAIAKMAIGGQRDIYVAKYVEKNPLKVELFAMAKTEEERQYVSWVFGEVSTEEAAKEAGKEYIAEPDDHVYGFSSPDQTWQDLCGRQGYLVVREGKIAQVIITMLN